VKRSTQFEMVSVTKQIFMQKHAVQIIIFLSYLLLSANINAQLVNPVEITFTTESKYIKVIEIKFDKFSMTNEIIDNNNYYDINLPGIAVQVEPGLPKLPVFKKFIEVPVGYEINAELNINSSKEYIGIVPVAAQKVPDRNQNLSGLVETPVFNEAVYHGNTIYPSKLVELGEVQYFGNKRVQELIVWPFQFDASKNTLTAFFNIEVTITYSQQKGKFNLSEPEMVSSYSIEKIADDFVLAFNSGERSKNEKVAPGMLIITHDDFYESILPFAEWKNRQGIKTKVVKISELGQKREAQDIRSQITQYLKVDANNFKNDYLLLVGDISYIPAFNGVYNALNDHGYSTLNEGDFLPDIITGRFSVNSKEECDIYVKKIINYERNIQPTDSFKWLKNAVVAASNDKLDDHHGKHIVSEFLKSGFKKVDDLRMSIQKFTGYNLINAINDGRSWVFYIGHGDETAWLTTGTFTKTTIDKELNYNGTTPAIISVACLNADLDYKYGDCFGEHWMNAGVDKGAVAFMGATELTPFFYSDTLGKHAMIGYLEGKAETFGEAMVYGKMKMYEAFHDNSLSGQTLETMQHFLVLGDPSIMPYTEIPAEISATLPDSVNTGYVNLSINVNSNGTSVKNALVAISTQDFEIHEAAYTDDFGNVNFTINLTDTGNLYVVISGKNLKTFEKTIAVSNYLGIDPGQLNHGAQVYPNPCHNMLSIRSEAALKLKKIQIINSLGEVVISSNNINESHVNITTSNFHDGVYFAEITDVNGNKELKKFMIFHP